MDKATLLINLLCTNFMLGLIWFVQIVHYPLFDRVGPDLFSRYEQDHARLTTWVVGVPMFLEAVTSALLLWRTPEAAPRWLLWFGLFLVVTIWLSTYLFQVPHHTTLGSGFDLAAHRGLVRTNWLRTAAWTLRAVIMFAVVWIHLVSISRTTP